VPVRQQHGRPGVGEDGADPVGGRIGIQRQVCRTGLQRGEDRGREVGAGLQAECDERAPAASASPEPAGHDVRAAVQVRIGQTVLAVDDSDVVRGAPGLRLEQLVQAGVRPGHRIGSVPVRQDRRPLGLGEQWQFADRTVRVGGDAVQQDPQMGRETLDGGVREQVGRVLQVAGQAVPARHERQREVELGDPVQIRDRGHHQPLRLGHRERAVVQREQHLKQWVAARVAVAYQLLDERLHRDVLIGESAKRGRPYPLQHFAERGVAVQSGAQRERVDEAADELLGPGARPSGDRRADDHVRLAGVPRQQHLERAEQDHEQGRPFRTGQFLQLAYPGRRHGERPLPAGVAGQRRAVMVVRQVQLRRRVRQYAAPVVQLGHRRAADQPVVLPAREVRVLDRQGGQVRWHAAGMRAVRRPQLAQEDPHRPPVGDQVMHGDRQQVVVVGEARDLHPDQGRTGEVERPAGLGADPVPRRPLALGSRHRPEVAAVRRERGVRDDDLGGLGTGEDDRGAQNLVAPHHVPGGASDEVGVQRAAQPHRQQLVVHRRLRAQLLDQPDPALCRRQRHRFGRVRAGLDDLLVPLGAQPLAHHQLGEGPAVGGFGVCHRRCSRFS
jgi:hypothetical protein